MSWTESFSSSRNPLLLYSLMRKVPGVVKQNTGLFIALGASISPIINSSFLFPDWRFHTGCLEESHSCVLHMLVWKWKSLSRVQLFATPWTKQSMEFSRPEYWSGQPTPSPGDLPHPGIEPGSPTLQADSLPAELSEQERELSKTAFNVKYVFLFPPDYSL